MQCPVSHVDCGPVTIGISLHKSVKLSNDSNCTLRFKLGVSQTLEAEDGTKEEISIGNHPHGKQYNFAVSFITFRITIKHIRNGIKCILKKGCKIII